MDGSGNVWVASPGIITEIPASNPSSPVTYCDLVCTVNIPYFLNFIDFSAIALDSSGNLWVTGNISATSNGGSNSVVPAAVAEVLSVAAPTRTPISSALKNGFKP